MAKKRKSDELFVSGTNKDAPLHDEILDNPKAEKKLNRLAVKRALARGVDKKLAKELAKKLAKELYGG